MRGAKVTGINFLQEEKHIECAWRDLFLSGMDFEEDVCERGEDVPVSARGGIFGWCGVV